MDVQVRHDLARIFPAEEEAERRRFLELLAALKALQQVADVVWHADSFEGKANLCQDKTECEPLCNHRHEDLYNLLFKLLRQQPL